MDFGRESFYMQSSTSVYSPAAVIQTIADNTLITPKQLQNTLTTYFELMLCLADNSIRLYSFKRREITIDYSSLENDDSEPLQLCLRRIFYCADRSLLYSMKCYVGAVDTQYNGLGHHTHVQSDTYQWAPPADPFHGKFGCLRSVLVAAGTVFNQIMIWRPILCNDLSLAVSCNHPILSPVVCPVLANIRGHDVC